MNLSILDSDQITKAARNLALNIFGKSTEPEEYFIKAKDGRQIPVEIQSRPVQTDGRMLMLGMIRNVAEKRKADAALRRAVEEIETLVERCRALEIKAQAAAEKNEE